MYTFNKKNLQKKKNLVTKATKEVEANEEVSLLLHNVKHPPSGQWEFRSSLMEHLELGGGGIDFNSGILGVGKLGVSNPK